MVALELTALVTAIVITVVIMGCITVLPVDKYIKYRLYDSNILYEKVGRIVLIPKAFGYINLILMVVMSLDFIGAFGEERIFELINYEQYIVSYISPYIMIEALKLRDKSNAGSEYKSFYRRIIIPIADKIKYIKHY